MEDLKAKYAAMHASGIAALRSGEFPPWTGITPLQGRNRIFAASFKSSVWLNKQLSTIREVGALYGVGLSMANQDFPFHVTIQQGVPGFGATELPNLVNRFELLVDQPISFGHLILGHNIVLASSQVPSLVTACRETVSTVMQKHSITPAPISILHATLARVTSVADATRLPRFIEVLETVAELVALEPGVLEINHLTLGTLKELLQMRQPER